MKNVNIRRKSLALPELGFSRLESCCLILLSWKAAYLAVREFNYPARRWERENKGEKGLQASSAPTSPSLGPRHASELIGIL